MYPNLDNLTPDELAIYERMERRRELGRRSSATYYLRHRDAVNARRRTRRAAQRAEEEAVCLKLAEGGDVE